MNMIPFFPFLALVVHVFFTAQSANLPADSYERAVPECKCAMSVDTKTDQGGDPGLAVAGCGACLVVFTEMVDVTKGTCTGNGCAVKGNCTGKLRVSITSVSSDCCSAVAGGFSPSWGSGWFAPGSGAIHTWDAGEVKCAEYAETKWTLKWRNAQLVETSQSLISKIDCSNCTEN
jgi:hypothetical protein